MAQKSLESDYRDAMACLAQSVTIVTTNGVCGLSGLTATAVASVSLGPPMVLVCVNRALEQAHAIAKNKQFIINTLAENQQDLADAYGGRTPMCTEWDWDSGLWDIVASGGRLLGSANHVECQLQEYYDAGTHRIFVGLVSRCDNEDDVEKSRPLLYWQRAYRYLETT